MGVKKKWILRDNEETRSFKVKFWSNVTPSVLMVCENGTGMPAISGSATGGKVRRHWRVPIRIDSDLLLLRPGHCDKTNCAKQNANVNYDEIITNILC